MSKKKKNPDREPVNVKLARLEKKIDVLCKEIEREMKIIKQLEKTGCDNDVPY